MAGRALVVGLGRFGGNREAARFLARRGWSLRVADRAPASGLKAGRDALADLDVEWRLGEEGADLLAGIDLVVWNPAVPPSHPLVHAAAARGIPGTQEVRLFVEAFPGDVVLVTGTDGKSTTATLLARALREAGMPALLGGNIGHSLLADEASWSDHPCAVLEVSSFQLERWDPGRLRVRGTVYTRIGSDHLDRHGSIGAYRAAKAVAAAAARDFVVHAADDPVAASFPTPAHRVPVGSGTPWREDGGWLIGEDRRLCHREALELVGAFHTGNAIAAAAAARQLGAAHHGIGLGLAMTRPLPHRLQVLGRLDGVTVYDNAVSTALASTRSAVGTLARHQRVHWVGGGLSKDGDGRSVARALLPELASAHLFGRDGGTIFRALATRLPASLNHDLEGALDAALRAAKPGDAVLFSPALASFDRYANFRERAAAFHRWFAARAAEGRDTAARADA